METKGMEMKSADLAIIYDKYTEQMANGLSGRLAGKYTCVVQKDTVFESKKNTYTNNNKILFLSEDLIMQYLSMGKVKEYSIVKEWREKETSTIYFNLYSLGNWHGIWINGDKTARTLSKRYAFGHFLFKYFADYYFYIWYRKRMSKSDDIDLYSKDIVEFLVKDENINEIFSD